MEYLGNSRKFHRVVEIANTPLRYDGANGGDFTRQKRQKVRRQHSHMGQYNISTVVNFVQFLTFPAALKKRIGPWARTKRSV